MVESEVSSRIGKGMRGERYRMHELNPMKFKNDGTRTKAHLHLVQVLSESLDLDQQFRTFVSNVTMNEMERDVRFEILDQMKVILQSEFPKVMLHPFGSLLSRLGDKDSDLDILIDYNGDGLPSTKRVDVAPLHSKRQREMFLTVYSILYGLQKNRNSVLSQVFQIPNARVPIIKATHVRTKINMDFSFDNYLSVRNSRLIEFLILLDLRVRPLMCIIRYWGKFHELTDSTKIKNYGLILLIIVFLNQKRILPSVNTLQNWPKPKPMPCWIDNWNAAFCDNELLVWKYIKQLDETQQRPQIEYDEMSRNPSCRSILQLMLEFCELYGNFNANTHVVCTLTGEFVPRRNFIPGYEQELPPELNSYKEWCYGQETTQRLNVSSDRHLVIQDPFLLNFNVSGCTSVSILQRFQCACIGTANILRKFLDNGPIPGVQPAKLLDIFRSIDFSEIYRRKENLAAKNKSTHVTTDCSTLNPQQPKQSGLGTRPSIKYQETFRKQFSMCGFNEKEVIFKGNALWVNFIKDFFLEFFSHSYALHVEPEVEIIKNKTMKIQKSQNSSASDRSKNIETESKIYENLPSGSQTSSNPAPFVEKYSFPVPPVDSGFVDKDSDSDGSCLSLNTIEFISAIIRAPNPHEIFESIKTDEYTMQKIFLRVSGTCYNVWDGRSEILDELNREKWETDTGDPMDVEAEITRRLTEKQSKEDTPVDLIFDCLIRIQPNNYKTVNAEVQLREISGSGVIGTVKTTLVQIIPEYIQYRYGLLTRELILPVPVTESLPQLPSSSSNRTDRKNLPSVSNSSSMSRNISATENIQADVPRTKRVRSKVKKSRPVQVHPEESTSVTKVEQRLPKNSTEITQLPQTEQSTNLRKQTKTTHTAKSRRSRKVKPTEPAQFLNSRSDVQSSLTQSSTSTRAELVNPPWNQRVFYNTRTFVNRSYTDI